MLAKIAGEAGKVCAQDPGMDRGAVLAVVPRSVVVARVAPPGCPQRQAQGSRKECDHEDRSESLHRRISPLLSTTLARDGGFIWSARLAPRGRQSPVVSRQSPRPPGCEVPGARYEAPAHARLAPRGHQSSVISRQSHLPPSAGLRPAVVGHRTSDVGSATLPGARSQVRGARPPPGLLPLSNLEPRTRNL